MNHLRSIFSIIVFQKEKKLWFPFKGNPRYIFGHSPLLQPYMLANSSIIFVLILMPTIPLSKTSCGINLTSQSPIDIDDDGEIGG